MAAGMRAIATASAAFAPVNGYEDKGHLPPDATFGALRRPSIAQQFSATGDNCLRCHRSNTTSVSHIYTSLQPLP